MIQPISAIGYGTYNNRNNFKGSANPQINTSLAEPIRDYLEQSLVKKAGIISNKIDLLLPKISPEMIAVKESIKDAIPSFTGFTKINYGDVIDENGDHFRVCSSDVRIKMGSTKAPPVNIELPTVPYGEPIPLKKNLFIDSNGDLIFINNAGWVNNLGNWNSNYSSMNGQRIAQNLMDKFEVSYDLTSVSQDTFLTCLIEFLERFTI